jgi:beta-phosphoglucomutase
MMFPPGIRAVVFDMDGVLWHSTQSHAAAYRAVLQQARLEMPDYSTLAGRRTLDVMREIVDAHVRRTGARPAMTAADLTDAKQAMAKTLLRECPPIAPGCADVLRELARDRRLALASSASAGTVDLFMETSGTRSLFAAVVHGDGVTMAKPDPELYLTVLRQLEVAGGEAAVVEDAPSGIRAALGAEVALVIGLEGTVSGRCIAQAGAHRVIRDLRDLVR